MSETSQFNERISEQKNKAFSFRSLGQLQFNFQINECDFVLWISSIKKKLLVAKQHKQYFIKNLIIEFFRVYLNIRIDSQFFAPRPQPIYSSANVMPIQNNFILYGVDFLSTEMINFIFYPLKLKVKWINDSACMLFTSLEEAEGLFDHLLDPEDYDLTEDNGEFPYRGWYQLKPYYVFGNQRKLFLRYATTNDFEVHHKQNINKYGHYETIVKFMPRYFLEKFEAIQIYKRKFMKKRTIKEKERMMKKQALRNRFMKNYWQVNRNLDQSMYYSLEEEYRFNDLNSSESENDSSFGGNKQDESYCDDGASYYSIQDFNDSFMYNLDDLEQFFINPESILEEIQ